MRDGCARWVIRSQIWNEVRWLSDEAYLKRKTLIVKIHVFLLGQKLIAERKQEEKKWAKSEKKSQWVGFMCWERCTDGTYYIRWFSDEACSSRETLIPKLYVFLWGEEKKRKEKQKNEGIFPKAVYWCTIQARDRWVGVVLGLTSWKMPEEMCSKQAVRQMARWLCDHAKYVYNTSLLNSLLTLWNNFA